MNICIVSTDYPAPSHPKYVFVEQLVNEMVNQGVDISVIAPQSITRHLLKRRPSASSGILKRKLVIEVIIFIVRNI